MRRRPGVAGIQTAAAARDKYRALGENVARQRQETLKEQLETFRKHLQDFAQKHKNDIRRNPEFRAQFHAMCAQCGVDPLASNKGFWAELLGIGDFYYELGVQIVEACIATRPANGGVLALQQLRQLVAARRRTAVETISDDDCLRAIKTLKALGNGFDVQTVGAQKIVRSLPLELNTDQNAVLEIAQVKGHVTMKEISEMRGWPPGRATDALGALLKEGLAMVDDGHEDGVRRFWFPCFDALMSTDTVV